MSLFITKYYIGKTPLNRLDIKYRICIYKLSIEEYLSKAEDWLEAGKIYVKYEDLDKKAKKRLKKTIEDVLSKDNSEIMQNPSSYVYPVYPVDAGNDSEVKVCMAVYSNIELIKANKPRFFNNNRGLRRVYALSD